MSLAITFSCTSHQNPFARKITGHFKTFFRKTQVELLNVFSSTEL